ncbi:MAG: YgiQ family radical SAM protein [Proteobacteria bacterium]|nr:YgiQ family radical SAM protein [Pseudomonadota bacterium]MBU1686094.1 YgiQ family radical SAM protein [Pseudomonadota bacterium]
MQPADLQKSFLPTTRAEILARGWDRPDIVLITGDAYVDHPSFGISLIGRWLSHHGYRVAILPQPYHLDARSFKALPPPRLFCGITSGNLDSIVANYTGNGKVRDQDAYSPGGNPYFGEERLKKERRRPDRATIRYTALAREAWPGVPIILGGLEASLRRFIHFDYQQERLRSSVLTDAKADLVVYGMGEWSVLEIARRLDRNLPLTDIAGTCEKLTEREFAERQKLSPSMILPSWDEIARDPRQFMVAEQDIDRACRAGSNKPLSQAQKSLFLWQNSPAAPLTPPELDQLYSLPFQRRPHPATPDVPAWRMIRDSITIVRGCSGNCSFCAITRHQGPLVISRSVDSITREVREVAATDFFQGTISDLGGPTANLYGTSCAIGGCPKQDCFFPKLCKNLSPNEDRFLALLERCSEIPGVKHIHISSGLRMELLLTTHRLLGKIIRDHLPGTMKIAPEHTDPEVLRLMHKPGGHLIREFLNTCRKIASQAGKEIRFTPYFIASHPGCTEQHMAHLAAEIKQLGISVRQFQDFTPTPGTLATAMYVSGLDRDTGKPIPVAKNELERRKQRQVLEGITLGKDKKSPGRKKHLPRASWKTRKAT